ncbi:EamA family transporter [Kitasatospora aureofaciens]|uniref:EamA family transporter n=1 Tax=Kitasatospora aureofaciens TaxID=1894 RepID=UPI001C483393|nr:EamA family transporter [Kitasatospora aureofaciens]MBV6699172.1 EamA family transporter [Kitasatospora aureofaciens]
MEANLRWVLLTALAPLAWGANYYVTRAWLPADQPLWGAALRALPAGLVLLALARRRPYGPWWWRSALLGLLNTAVFFVLLYLASQQLPTSVAATVMAASPLAMLLTAWALAGQHPQRAHLAGAVVGLGGVALMLLGSGGAVSGTGLVASSAAMLVSSVGYVLAARWREGADPLAATSWQLTAGGLLLLPVAAVAEGAPPAMDATVLLAFGYVTLVATALAFALWFAGLRHLPAGTVGLLGLLNPLAGVLLGTAVAGEDLGPRQGAGLALVLAGVLLGRPRTPARPDPAEPAPAVASLRTRR